MVKFCALCPVNVSVCCTPVETHVAEPGVWYVISIVTVPVKGPLKLRVPEKQPLSHSALIFVISMCGGGLGLAVGLGVGGTGVLVGVAVGGTGVLVGVAVGGSGVFVGVGTTLVGVGVLWVEKHCKLALLVSSPPVMPSEAETTSMR